MAWKSRTNIYIRFLSTYREFKIVSYVNHHAIGTVKIGEIKTRNKHSVRKDFY